MFPLFFTGGQKAAPESHPYVLKRSNPSSHPTALASQVAWITGESKIKNISGLAFSRYKKITELAISRSKKIVSLYSYPFRKLSQVLYCQKVNFA
jgi:hypothetical protein